LICVSELDRFLVHHLPNKYVNVLGVRREVLNEQIEAIIAIEKNLRPRGQFIPVESKLPDRAWSKLYYEGDRPEILTCVPLAARSVLSVGCGSGALEQSLISRGCRVVGWPLDSVIGAWAEKKGVEIRYGNTRTVQQQLGGERFDCLLLLDILHLNSEPISFLSSFARLLAPGGVMVISTPNFHLLRIVLRELFRLRHLGLLGGFSASGVQLTSERAIRKWLDVSKLRFEKCVKVVPRRSRFLRRWGAKVWGEVFAEELLIVGKSL
jgi:2-polyprenyl-3-methyl-5-hydroxy-6-metoxy-1,4-benzoquinol methylase